MFAYIVRRVLLMIPTLFGIMLVNFVIIQAAPGGPVEQMIAQIKGQAGGALERVTGAGGELAGGAQQQAQTAAGPREAGHPDAVRPETLLAEFDAAVEAALDQLRATDAARLLDARGVGRARLPSTVLGLLFHAAEHAQRHAGQIATTRRMVRT